MLKCSRCKCLIEPIDLDGGYYIEESLHPRRGSLHPRRGSLHPRRGSLHNLKCLDTQNNTIKEGYVRVNKVFVLEIYGGANWLRVCGI